MASGDADVRVRDFRLLKLTLVDVGPFREHIEIDFLGIADDGHVGETRSGQLEPANFFLLLSKNGFGKTTALEMIALLCGMLGQRESRRFGHVDLDEGVGKVQADFRGNWTIDGARSSVVLSVWAGSDGPVRGWSQADIQQDANASEWACVSFVRDRIRDRIALGPGTNPLGSMLVGVVRDAVGLAPPGLFGQGCSLPTVMLFPADRALRRPMIGARQVSRPTNWGYQSSFRFDVDGVEWNDCLDNLLVWLSWIGDGRDELLRSYVGRWVFVDGGKNLLEVDRERLSTNVKTTDGVHSLYSLSHGERQILQLIVRTAVHMTNCTILLIDEVEMHLHPKWRVALLDTLRALVKEFEGLSVIMTTHERELIHEFGHELGEEGLVKGGYLIERDL